MIIKLKNLYIYLIISIILSVEKKIYFFLWSVFSKILDIFIQKFFNNKKNRKARGNGRYDYPVRTMLSSLYIILKLNYFLFYVQKMSK